MLQTWWLHRELELVVEFCQQQIVGQRLSHLHDADNGRVNLVLAVLEDPFLCRFLFIIGLFQLDLKTNLLVNTILLERMQT